MRRKKRLDHVSHDRWLVSYADFITLLFAFFVVLYASAQVDKRKVGRLALAIQVGFKQMGVFDSSNTKPQVLGSETVPDDLENSQRDSQAASPDRPNMDEIEKQLKESLAPEIKKNMISVTPTKEGIVVSLRELGFFDIGSTKLRPEAIPTLAQFIKVIGPLRARVRIEGHTDNIPIHNARFDSNWELSTGRATEIIKLFIVRYAVAPVRLSASGYGEYFPVTSNDTPEGRNMNRRVDLVILNSTAESGPQLPSRPTPSPPVSPAN